MKITIKNVWNVSDYIPNEKSILISIVDDSNLKLDFYNKYINVLKLTIDDIDTCLIKDIYLKNYEVFNEIHYKKIINFIELNNNINEIVIHCSLGVSRSPAIGIGLCKYLGLEDEFLKMINSNKYMPNLNILSYFCNVENLVEKRLKEKNEKIKETISFSIFDLDNY